MFTKLLVPVDGSETSLKAVQIAGEMARRFEASVVLLHVVQLPATVISAAGMVAMAGVDQSAVQALEESARGLLSDARLALGLPEERVTEEIAWGHPAESICRVAEERESDLVVMGSRGLSGVRAFFLGSVSDKVSHHAPCPVLIVR